MTSSLASNSRICGWGAKISLKKTDVIVVDVDGTLLALSGLPNDRVIRLVSEYQQNYRLPIVILTSRHEILRSETEKFVNSCGIAYLELIMCRDEDLAGISADNMQTTFKTNAIKRSVYNPVVIFDDNPAVLAAFKKRFSCVAVNAATLEVV